MNADEGRWIRIILIIDQMTHSIIDFRIFRNLVEFLALGDSDPIQIPAKIFSLDDGFV